MAIRADDLEVGGFITISRGPVQKSRGGMFGFGEEDEHENAGMNGVVLRVLAVSLPYIACEVLTHFIQPSYWSRHDEAYGAGKRISLDYRKVRLVKVSREYAEALCDLKHEEEVKGGGLGGLARKQPAAASAPGSNFIQANPNCSRCGGRDYEHASTCPHNPKGKK